MDEQYKIIFTRRNDKIINNIDMFDLCRDSYIGGSAYTADKYLIHNSTELEPNSVFEFRSDIISYTNHEEPLLDIVIGSIYRKDPDRSRIPSYLDYVFNDIYKGKDLDLFMRNIGTQSQLYPVAVLIDSPTITQPITMAERQLMNLNPFCVIYKYDEIRDFAVDSYGKLLWILLDNTYIDNTNPFVKPKEIITYTLWDTEKATSFTRVSEHDVSVSSIGHNLGEVPVILAGFNNLDNDSIESNPFQNIALSSRKIYNVGSLIDSALFNGTFQLLIWPGKAPEQMASKGCGTTAVAECEMDSPFPPQFIKSGMEDITPYITEIKRQEKDIYHTLGFKDPESEAVQYDSGKLKNIEYAQKTKNILYKIAVELEHVENEIIRICALYDQQDIDPEIIYNKDFDVEDVNNIKAELDNMFKIYPYDSLRKETAKQRAILTLGEDHDKLDEIINDIEQTGIEEVVTTTITDEDEKNQ